jgi:hypothetical protein
MNERFQGDELTPVHLQTGDKASKHRMVSQFDFLILFQNR